MHGEQILVTGATGTQGAAVLTQLLAQGYRVRALTRNPSAVAALALAAQGAEVVSGDYDDAASLEAALRDVWGLFSVLVPSLGGSDSERLQAQALFRAAQRAGVQHVVHSSVSGVDLYAAPPAGTESLWDRAFWQTKHEIEQAARAAAFPALTILRPAFFMENVLPPKVAFTFPELPTGELVIAMDADVQLALVATQDIAAFAALAFAAPERYNGLAIELAGDRQTIPALAAILSSTVGRPISARCLTPDAAIAQGKHPILVQHQAWANTVGYPADPALLQGYGLALTTFAAWAMQHRAALTSMLAAA